MNHGTAGKFIICNINKRNINTVRREGFFEKYSIGTDFSGVENGTTGTGKSNGLIETFAACAAGKTFCGKSFSGTDKFLNGKHIINIQGAEI